VARLQIELARGLGDLLEHELRIELDEVVALARLARRAEQLDGPGDHDFNPEPGDNPPPAPIEDVNRVLAEDLVAGHGVDEHGCDPNIFTMEQEFQGTQTINRAAQLLTLVIESQQPPAPT